MRRVVFWVWAAVIAAGGFAVAAYASPSPSSAAVAAPVPGKAVCTISDDRLTEISGMVATSGGYVVVNDGSDQESHRKIFFLTGKCKLDHTVSYPSSPRDTEDMAAGPDGTLWIADIGDNVGSSSRRSNIALWRLPKGADEPTLYRMKYPDGPHDAEALLLAGDGTPIIVTKDIGKAGIYTPTAALKKGQTVELRRAGEFTLPKTTTSNPFAAAGRLTVTGGANAPDGSRVVLRTYADAFEFEVTDGNVVDAIAKGTPRVTPLPDEPRGESITYSSDGKSFLTVSETAAEPDNTKPKILRYEPATTAPQVNTLSTGPAGKADARSWFDKLTLTDITYMIGAVGVLGLLLVGVGVLGIVRARRRSLPDGAAEGAPATGNGLPPVRQSRADERPTAQISPISPGGAGTARVSPVGAGAAQVSPVAAGAAQVFPGGAGSVPVSPVRGEPDYEHDPSVWAPAGTRGEYGRPSAPPPQQYSGSGREYRSGGGEYRSGPGEYRSGGGEHRSGAERSSVERPDAGRSGAARSGGTRTTDGTRPPAGRTGGRAGGDRGYQPTGRGERSTPHQPSDRSGGVYGGQSTRGATAGGTRGSTADGKVYGGRPEPEPYPYGYADPEPHARH